MRAIRRIAINLALACLTVSAPVSASAPEISAAWQEVLGKIDALQADPLKLGAKEDGASIVKWLIDSKEVSVTLCADLTVELTTRDDSLGGLLILHSLLGAAKYAMTVTPKLQAKPEMYLASLDSALNAYQKMVASDSSNRREKIEKVLELRAAGQLRQYVQKHSRKCKR